MSDDAPNRLVTSSEDAGLRTLLEHGRRELPSEAQLASLVAKAGPPGGGGGRPGGHGGPGSGAGGGWSLGAKALVALIVGAGAAAVATVALVHPAPAPKTEAPSSLPAMTVAAPTALPPVDAIVPAPSVSLSAPTAAATVRPTPAVAASAASVSDEVALVEHAQDALRSDAARALVDCDEHARRYPKGLLVQEREVVAIDALTRLGRRDEAEARARKFAASFPASSHLRRIATILGHAP